MGFQSVGNSSSLNDDTRFLFLFVSLIVIMALGLVSLLAFGVTLRRLGEVKKEKALMSSPTVTSSSRVSGATLQGYQNHYGSMGQVYPSSPPAAAGDATRLL